MARTLEEFQKAMAENVVNISEAEFHEKAAEVMSEGAIKELIISEPAMIMAFTIFAVELSKAIFGFSNNKESEVAE